MQRQSPSQKKKKNQTQNCHWPTVMTVPTQRSTKWEPYTKPKKESRRAKMTTWETIKLCQYTTHEIKRMPLISDRETQEKKQLHVQNELHEPSWRSLTVSWPSQREGLHTRIANRPSAKSSNTGHKPQSPLTQVRGRSTPLPADGERWTDGSNAKRHVAEQNYRNLKRSGLLTPRFVKQIKKILKGKDIRLTEDQESNYKTQYYRLLA